MRHFGRADARVPVYRGDGCETKAPAMVGFLTPELCQTRCRVRSARRKWSKVAQRFEDIPLIVAEQYGFLAGLWYKGGSQDFWHRSRTYSRVVPSKSSPGDQVRSWAPLTCIDPSRNVHCAGYCSKAVREVAFILAFCSPPRP